MDETPRAFTAADASVGVQLQQARLARGEDLGDIAGRTRIPLRHLQAIEAGQFGDLPSPTYALGFVRSYARALELPETPLIDATRRELGRIAPVAPATESYNPADPARVPGKLLAWTALALAVLAALAYAWATGRIGASADPAITASPGAAINVPVGPRAAAPTPTDGQVTLTARAPVWVEVRDAGGPVLISRELAAGERFDVPRDARNPIAKTGRADQLQVTVNGSEVAALGPPQRTIRDIPVSAAALLARTPAPATGAAPAGNTR